MNTTTISGAARTLRRTVAVLALAALPWMGRAQTNLWLTFTSPATNSAPNAPYSAVLGFEPSGMTFSTEVTSGTNIVSVANAVQSVGTSNVTVTLTPTPNKSGPVGVSVTGILGGWTNTVPFLVEFLPCIPVVLTPAFTSPATNATPGASFSGEVAFSPTNAVLSLAVTGNGDMVLSNVVTKVDSANALVTVAPKNNRSGLVSLLLTATTDCATNTFPFDVYFKTYPPVIGTLTNVTMKEDGVLTVSFTVSDPDTNLNSLDFSAASSNTTLIATSDMTFGGSGGNRTLSLDPKADENGTSRITVTVSDGENVVTKSFQLVVQPVNDVPTISGTSNKSTTDIVSITPFSTATIADVDQDRPSNEYLDLTVELASPSGGLNPVYARLAGDTLKFTSADGLQADLTTTLRGLVVYPVSNAVPPGTSVQVVARVIVSDAGFTVTNATTITITSVNDPPTIACTLNPSTSSEGQTTSPFVLSSVTDPDIGDASFTLRIELVNPAQSVLGTFSENPTNGPATVSGLQTFLANLAYTVSVGVMSNILETVDFRFLVYDGFGGVATNVQTLTLYQLQNPPQISGVPLQTVALSDRAVPYTPFPTVFVSDSDLGGTQLLDAQLSQSVPSLGTFSQSQFNDVTPAQLTALLRSVRYTPNPGVLPINTFASTILTIRVTDSTALSAQNNNLTLHITSVNNPPRILNVPPADQQPVLIPPVAPLRPFAGLGLTSDDANDILFNIVLDNANKGDLTNLGTFTALGGGKYQMVGQVAAILSSLTNLVFVLNPAYNFPSDDPGGTVFTLTARDFALLTATASLAIQVQDEPRNHLVVRTVDDGLPGSLSYALARAGNNDVVTIALPEYPAVLRMTGTTATTLSRNVTLKGPGANLVTISGDSDGDGDPDRQLLRIASRVTIEGVTFARGMAGYGGAIAVQTGGNLTLRRCAVVDSVAAYYGGGIDVDGGQLTLDGCFIGRNRLEASTGMSGAGVSIYSDLNILIQNTTFSENLQPNAMGDGGGALVVQNVTDGEPMNAFLYHCTFAANSDASGRASAALAIGSGVFIRPQYSIFSDFSGRNLNVAAAGEFNSLGANLCDDSTRVTLSQGGQSEEVHLLDHSTDIIGENPLLSELEPNGDPTPFYGLQRGSKAIEHGVDSYWSVDQRGVQRVGVPDSGAIEYNALGRLVVNEVQFSAGSVNFVELYVPRHSTPVDLAPYALFVDGVKVHDFVDGVIVGTNALFTAGISAPTLVNPGYGMVVAFTNVPMAMTSALNPTPVVRPSVSNAISRLSVRSEISVGVGGAQQPIARQNYLGVYLDPVSGTNLLNTAGNSITLAPQFRGFAFIPHSFVLPGPFAGVDASLDPTTFPQSPGADAMGTPFGQDNAEPLARTDTFTVTEDDATFLPVVDNDFDGDGNDRLVVVDVSPLSDPDSGDVGLTNSLLGAVVAVEPSATPLRGDGVVFDPRLALTLQQLPEGVEVVDTFSYEVLDVGFGPVEAYGIQDSTTTVTVTHHRLLSGNEVVVSGSSVTNYNGTFAITVINANTFSIPVAYVGPALTLGTWQTVARRVPTSRSEASVAVRVLGVNDPPVGVLDTITNVTEESTIRLMVRPELAGVPLSFRGDPVPPPDVSAQNVLANDLDIDSDDTWSSLRVVGVLGSVNAISNYYGTVGAAPVTVHAPAHGLANGTSVLIANYGGHPSYNGYHVATVVDADTFTIPKHFVDNHAVKGVWCVLAETNRYAAVTVGGATVRLTLRANAQESHFIYDAEISPFLDGLAEGELFVDRFWYAVSDSHGAIGLGAVDVDVTGVNDVPIPTSDPNGLGVLAPLVTSSNSLDEVLLDGLDLLYTLPPQSGGTNRTDLHVLDKSGAILGTLVLSDFFATDEDTPLGIETASLLANDTDIDRLDVPVLSISAVDAFSRDGAAVSLAGGVVTYDPTSSTVLQALARNEMRIDSFSTVLFDGKTGGVATSLVAVLVVGVNDTPVANPDERTTHEDETYVFDPRTNDVEIDIDGVLPDDRIGVVPAENVANPGLADVDMTISNVLHDATVSALLNQLAHWQVFTNKFDYTISDNSFLFAVDDDFHVPLGTTNRLLDVLANDRDWTDAAGGPITVFDAGPTLRGGSVAVVSNGTLLAYAPPSGFIGDDVFRYRIRNAVGDQSAGRVVVRTVFPPLNGILHAADDHFAVAAGETIALDVLANDNMLPLASAGLTLQGVVATSVSGQPILTNNTFVYTADGGVSTLTFTYEVSAGGTAVAQADVVVEIVERRGTLHIQDDTFSVLPGSIGNELDVLANDGLVSESKSAYRVAQLVDPVAHGTLATNAEATRLVYTPNVDFVGIETIRYLAVDQIGGSGTGLLTIVVGQVEVVPDFFKLAAAASAPVGLDVLLNDRLLPAVRGTLTITDSGVVDPAGLPNIGTLTETGGTGLVFTANGVIGARDFRYVVQDGGFPLRSATGTVSIVTVVPGTYANPDRFSVRGGGSGYVLDVLANDRSHPGLSAVYSILGIGTGGDAPSAGGVVLIVDNRLVYTPVAGFYGEETFTYTMSDSVNTDVARVTVSVRRGDLLANSDHYAVFYEWDGAAAAPRTFDLPVALNDRIQPPLGQVFSIVGLGVGANAPDQGGTVTVAPNGLTLSYRPGTVPSPEFTERFSYEIADGTDRRASCTVRVRVRNRADQLAALTQDDAFTVARNSTNNVLAVLANDFVRPGTAANWSITSVSTTTNGGTVAVQGSNVRYTPPVGFVGVDEFGYSVSDGLGGTGGATVRVRVGDLPTLPSGFVALAGSVDNELDVLANDVLLESYREEYVLTNAFGTTEGGSVVVGGGNRVLYAPDPAYSGPYPYTEFFEYTVLDDSAIAVTGAAHVVVHDPVTGRSTAVISLVVEGRNDPPEIFNTAPNVPITDKETATPFTGVTIVEVDQQLQERIDVSVDIDDPIKGSITNLGAFVDIGGGSYALTNVTAATATAAIRQLVYVPVENRITVPTSEPVVFTITVTDNKSASVVDTQTVIEVTAVNDAPVVVGTQADQRFYYLTTIAPFGDVQILEVDDLELQPLTVTVGLVEPTQGLLLKLGSFVDLGGGVYRAVGLTAAEATAQLRTLEFSGGTNSVPVGGAMVTHLVLTVEDGFAPPVVDAATSVVALNAYGGTTQAPSDATAGSFGLAVDTIADYAVVGAPNASTNGTNSGVAFVYQHVPGSTNVWTEWRQLLPATVGPGARFGRAVSISDEVIAVSAPEQDVGAGQLGSVYLFHRDVGGMDNWGEWMRLVPTNALLTGRFGQSIALSGDVLAVGAPDATIDGGGAIAGAVFLFGRHVGGTNAWGEIMRWAPSGAGSDDGDFGRSVALSGDTLIVGAPEFNASIGTTNREGSVFHFERNQGGSNAWGLVAMHAAAETTLSQTYGWSVAVGDNGFAVGAPAMTAGTNEYAGRVYLYARASVGEEFTYRRQLDQRNDVERRFGYSVAMDADRIFVGAPENGSVTNNIGASYLYEDRVDLGGDWTLVEKFKRPAGSTAGLFGRCIGFRQGAAIVGAPVSYVGGVSTNRGHVFFYRFDYEALDRPLALAPRAAWNRVNFGDDVGDPLTEANVWGGDANPDADTASNDEEYAFVGDPNIVDDVGVLAIERDVSGNWLLFYNRRSDDSAITYVLEASPDMGSWSDWSTWIVSETAVAFSTQGERATLVVEPDVANPTLFFRIRATW